MSQVKDYIDQLIELNKSIKGATARLRKEVSSADKALNKVLDEIEYGLCNAGVSHATVCRIHSVLKCRRAASNALARLDAINYTSLDSVVRDAEKRYQSLSKKDDAIRQIAN